jgi:hypothetical protein
MGEMQTRFDKFGQGGGETKSFSKWRIFFVAADA